jgi:endonuclease/exonuclease/phosphatase family metal-dependent hydrolase
MNDSSNIKCIQEFKSSIKNTEMGFSKLMERKGYEKYSFIFQNSNGNQYGIATFSRYPIISTGNLLFNRDSKNNCIYTDIVVADDTIRIYNVHLSSMSIPKLNKSYLRKYGTYLKTVIQKLKEGAIKHADEINLLISHTSQSPYKFIICGDFNEIPYSYNYFKLRKHYNNSFEEAGAGFGFSFNSRRLFFLRIDHHFVSKGIRPVLYRIDHNVRKSGHFPTRGIYEIL